MSDEKDPKSLEDLLGENSSNQGNNQDDKSIDDIINLDTADKMQDKKDLDAEKDKKRKLAFIGGGILVVVVIAGGLLNPWFGPDLLGINSGPEKLAAATLPPDSVDEDATNVKWWEDGDVEPPVSIPSWAKELANNDATKLDKAHLKYADKELRGTKFKSNTETQLPGEESGYTSDLKKMKRKNGGPNALFSFITSEIFLNQSQDIVDHLLLPEYGGWDQYQFSDSNAKTKIDPKIFAAITSESYQNNNFGKKNKSYLPIYADWKGDDYGVGNKLLPDGPRWFGKVTDAKVKYNYDKSNINYEMNATYKVKYTAWTTDQKKLTRNGTLKIKFISDRSSIADAKSYRIKIDNASLTIND